MTDDKICDLWAETQTRGLEVLNFARAIEAECEKDAARYRWFVANLDTSDPTNPLNVLADAIGNRAPTKNELDAAIDEAMKEST